MPGRAIVAGDLLVNIDVPDLEAAVEFYTAALGLRLARRLGPDIAELAGDSARVYLIRQAAGSAPFAGAEAARDYRRHWTPVHLDLAVEELEPALRRAEAAGARREGAIREQPWGRYAVLADPFGHGFCLVEFRGRRYASLEA
jgi:lactoylglutathione lyase